MQYLQNKKKLILCYSNVYMSHVMLGGDGRSLGHCGSDIVCVGFSWNDRGGGGGWRKIYLIIHCYICHLYNCTLENMMYLTNYITLQNY